MTSTLALHAASSACQAEVFGSDPITLEERAGSRYWVRHPFAFTNNAAVDERLAGFPVAIFLPHERDPRSTPLVVGLQGMAAPFQWNGFLVPTLLDMGIACALFDAPLAGERSLARRFDGDVIAEAAALIGHGVPLEASLMAGMMEAVAGDFRIVLRLAEERHGLTDPRRALFGVSLGTLLAGFAFTRDGIGARLLGSIGHADLALFARSYAPRFTPFLASRPVRAVAQWVGGMTGKRAVTAAVEFVALLRVLCQDQALREAADPMTHAARVGRDRRVRFLVGQADPVVRPQDAASCAARFPDGACYVVPGMGHGGGDFVGHVRTFIGTQLGDWR